MRFGQRLEAGTNGTQKETVSNYVVECDWYPKKTHPFATEQMGRFKVNEKLLQLQSAVDEEGNLLYPGVQMSNRFGETMLISAPSLEVAQEVASILKAVYDEVSVPYSHPKPAIESARELAEAKKAGKGGSREVYNNNGRATGLAGNLVLPKKF